MPPTSFLILWLRNKIHFAVIAGTQTTRFWVINNEQHNFSFEMDTEDKPDGQVHKHPHSILEQCIRLLPFLVVHHHLTEVILIGITTFI